jgi:uncharacterized YigZ family protein
MEPYRIPAENIETEIIVVNSRFITAMGPVFSPEEAREFISKIRSKYPDASHHVPAYIIGFGASTTTHCSDDGEPSGTAGRPALAVIQGSGLGDIIVVVTRYFGGTKLGTGGLVRAYTDAVKAGLNILPLARKIAVSSLLVAFKYTFLERIRQIARSYNARILDETFTTDVTLTIQLPDESLAEFRHAVTNLTAASAQVEVIESGIITILPL